MADLLSLGAQGVYAAQRQLNTTGHNISNANTKGYSRQRVEQGTNESVLLGRDRWGTGVNIQNVHRNYDKFAINELNIATSIHAHAVTRNEKVSILDNMMSFSAKKIPDNMNEFFGALTALADTPNDMGARKVVLENAKIVSDSMNDINNILQNQNNDTAEEIKGTVQRITSIGQELVQVHAAIAKNGEKDNDLLDKHQMLINELSNYTQVTVNKRKNGSYNVLIGTGHTLVSGVNLTKLTTLPNPIDGQKISLALVAGESVKPILHQDIGGKLSALFEYQEETLKNARNEIGLLTLSFATKLNELQSQGYDLNGLIGKNIFRNFNEEEIAVNRVIKKPSSTAKLRVFIENLSALKPGDYRLSFDGSQYKLIDSKQHSIQVTPTGTPPVIKIDGLKIQIDQSLEEGEQVIIRPMEYAAGQIAVEMTDPSQIAAQSFVTSSSTLLGDANLKILSQGAQKEFQVLISSDGSRLSILDMENNVLKADINYPSIEKLIINGTEFSLTDGALPNDRFVVSLLPADGDNSNLLKMQELQRQKILYQGRSSMIDIFEKLNSEIGTEKSTFERLKSISQAELDAATGRVSEISGVNLDEEAANMIKFQQAYMASSRVLSAANEAFDALLNATR